VGEALDAAQGALLAEATERQASATTRTATLDDAIDVAQKGFAVVPTDAIGVDGEARLNDAGVSVRLLRRLDTGLPIPGEEAGDGPEAVVAKAY
jgi:prolyl-tRNA synthetase